MSQPNKYSTRKDAEPALPLPISYFTDKRRQRLIEMYDAKLSRVNDPKTRLDILENFYEQVYSRGIEDNDRAYAGFKKDTLS